MPVEPKKPMDWVTPPVHPNIKELLIQLGYTTSTEHSDDETVRKALLELLDRRRNDAQKGPPDGTPIC